MKQALITVDAYQNKAKNTQYYIINLPTNNKDKCDEHHYYAQNQSLDYFLLREHKYCLEILRHTNPKSIQEWIKKIEEAGDCTIVPITCDGVYDFYNKIGYEYKKKRYNYVEGPNGFIRAPKYNESSGRDAAHPQTSA